MKPTHLLLATALAACTDAPDHPYDSDQDTASVDPSDTDGFGARVVRCLDADQDGAIVRETCAKFYENSVPTGYVYPWISETRDFSFDEMAEAMKTPNEFLLPQDCNDNDSSIYPSAPEVIGGDVDSNCDGRKGVGIKRFGLDRDGDNYRDNSQAWITVECGGLGLEDQLCYSGSVPPGLRLEEFIAGDGDCDDQDPDINPGKEEIPGNNQNDDCDPLGEELCYKDLDGDGIGSEVLVPTQDPQYCAAPGLAFQGEVPDCDDTNPAISPVEKENPFNEGDDNCDKKVNEMDCEVQFLTDPLTPIANSGYIENYFNAIGEDPNNPGVTTQLDLDIGTLVNPDIRPGGTFWPINPKGRAPSFSTELSILQPGALIRAIRFTQEPKLVQFMAVRWSDINARTGEHLKRDDFLVGADPATPPGSTQPLIDCNKFGFRPLTCSDLGNGVVNCTVPDLWEGIRP